MGVVVADTAMRVRAIRTTGLVLCTQARRIRPLFYTSRLILRDRAGEMGGRFYLWLVCHDACPCQWCRILHLPRSERLYRLCDWLERRYFILDDSVVMADEVALRMEGDS